MSSLLDVEIEYLNNERLISRSALKNLQDEQNKAERAWDEDFKRCSLFRQAMEDAYGKELQERHQNIMALMATNTTSSASSHPRSVARGFLELLAAIDLADARQEVLLTV